MKNQFWRGKKVFITGHTGFKGGWLTAWLKSLGADVTGYALAPNTKPSLFEHAKIGDGTTSIIGDILDADKLSQSVQKHEPEIVFHMAAQPLVHYSYENPVETFSVNVVGTANVLEAIRKVKSVRAIIVVTSDKCYENKEWVWGYRESDAMGGYDPYSSSKGCTELVASSYRRSFFNVNKYDEHRVALATVRAGNVIGGGDWSEARLVPDLMRAFTDNKVTQIRNPNACRPWQHVLDVLDGYLCLAERLFTNGRHYADAWNFGPSDENIKSVGWIADKAVEIWGQGVRWELIENKFNHEAQCLKLDCNKARAQLNWSPKLSITDTLKMTLDWYKAFNNQKDMKQYTENQISEYVSREKINE